MCVCDALTDAILRKIYVGHEGSTYFDSSGLEHVKKSISITYFNEEIQCARACQQPIEVFITKPKLDLPLILCWMFHKQWFYLTAETRRRVGGESGES